jgi:phosphopantetheinyl transferase
MDKFDAAGSSASAFRVFTASYGSTNTALWQTARELCDEALAQGLAFVAILHEAHAVADEGLLADEDLQRAAHFRQAGDRYNFVLGRTMVHHLIRQAGISAPSAFSFADHGKPFLPGRPAFNISHSGAWVACAVSRNALIGIDIETFGHLQDYRALLAVVTHPNERRSIDKVAADEQGAWFKRCWTRKEAVLKAIGSGLSDDLCSIDVRLEEGEPVLDHPASLRIVDLAVGDEHMTASLALDVSVPGVMVMFASLSGLEDGTVCRGGPVEAGNFRKFVAVQVADGAIRKKDCHDAVTNIM